MSKNSNENEASSPSASAALPSPSTSSSSPNPGPIPAAAALQPPPALKTKLRKLIINQISSSVAALDNLAANVQNNCGDFQTAIMSCPNVQNGDINRLLDEKTRELTLKFDAR